MQRKSNTLCSLFRVSVILERNRQRLLKIMWWLNKSIFLSLMLTITRETNYLEGSYSRKGNTRKKGRDCEGRS